MAAHGSTSVAFIFKLVIFVLDGKDLSQIPMAALPRTFAASTYNASRVSCIIFSSDPTTAPHAQYNFILYNYIVDQD